ncbi:MAG: DUF4911 domain-containing protein [Candidatus Saccharibacteria bacterium]
MTKRYRGDNLIGRVAPDKRAGYSLEVSMAPSDVHFFVDLIQVYGHLAFPASINPKAGLVLLHTTPGCMPDLKAILGTFPVEVSINVPTESQFLRP